MIFDATVINYGGPLNSLQPNVSWAEINFELLRYNAIKARHIIMLLSRDVIDEITAGDVEPFLTAFNRYVGNTTGAVGEAGG